ncbi:uncharacterized protein LOC105850951 isoform X1 [Hydra vulgaris]|uniref:uncharacterized protein LOC105850951 isoform X1 n=2 Tax=Hydra vulgaris TaxID=6087 RepID=UPI001F5E689E|nr:uncharacterized protein LOC105850951 isoform X1 [Hydra vulgaris]
MGVAETSFLCIILTVIKSYKMVVVPLYSKQEETLIEYGKKLTVLDVVPQEYIVSFEVKPMSYKPEWQSVFHMTPGGDMGYAERNSAFFVDSYGVLFIMSPINGTTQSTETTVLPLISWTKLEVSQLKTNGKFIYSISINETIVYTTVNNDAQNFSNVVVYAADVYYSPQNGSIRYLSISDPVQETTFDIEPLVNITYKGVLKSKLLSLGLSLNLSSNLNTSSLTFKPDSSLLTFNMTISYFFPIFFANISESKKIDFEKNDGLHHKYMWTGSLKCKETLTHEINANLDEAKIPTKSNFTLEVPVEISLQNYLGKRWTQFRTFRTNFSFLYNQKLNIPRHPKALPESYGRGIYWDSTNSHIYVCKNQHVISTKTACYYSNNLGALWAAIDVSIGSIIGHHSITRELYAVHRNQKTYLMFHNTFQKWFSLNDDDFYKYSARYINPNMRKNLEGDNEKVVVLGLNEWKGDADGIYFRKFINDSWVQRVKWKI